MANITITALPTAGPITGAELVPIVQYGVTVQTTAAAISASPSQFQPFLTVGQQTTLPNSRALGAGTGLVFTDGGPQSALTLSVNGALLSLVNSGTGLQVKTGSTTVTNVQIAVGTGLTITSPDGLSGNPTIGLAPALQNIVSTVGTGLLAISGSVISATAITGTTNQITVTNGTTTPTIGIAANPVLPGTASATLPSGASALRPAVGVAGMIRYNLDMQDFEGYTNIGWQQFGVSNIGVTTFSAGTTGLTPSAISNGAITLGGVLNVLNGGSGVTTSTGTGNLVLSTSPTLVTPALGTPSSVVLTNATGTAAALNIGGNAATATNVAYSGLTGTVPTWNQNTTGNAATATNVAYSGLTGTVPTWNQNTTGTAAGLNASQVDILFTPQASAPTATRGAVWYDSTLDALAYNNSLGEVALGQQVLLQYCYNNTGTTIASGAAVYINGQFGNSPSVALATAAAIATSNVIGLAVVAIPNGTYGYVINQGVLANINTSSFTPGQTLYLSASTPGGVVSTIPGTQFYNYRIGICTVSSATIGQIFVEILTAYVLPTSIVSPITFTAQSTTYTPLQIYGYSSGQIADLLNVWTYSGGTKALGINNTGLVTIPALATTNVSVSGQITSTVATGTAPIVVTSTTAVANLSIGGTAALATSNSGGLANQIQYQTAPNTTGFITAPTVTSTYLVWNGSTFVWTLSSAYNPASVAITGGTIDGTAIGSTTASTAKFTTPATGDNSTNAATTAFVNNTVANLSGKNVLINGDMSISQINGGTAVTPTTGFPYILDQWYAALTQSSKLTFQQVTTSLNSIGAPLSLKFTTAAAFTSASSDYFQIIQPIEGSNFDRFFYGSANARSGSLQFKANASIAGTYSGAITNAATTRSYVFTFILAANTDTLITIQNILGDSSGTWLGATNAAAATIRFDLGSGSNYKTTAGTWQTGNYIGATGSASLVANAGATLAISEVQFELGPVCTAYERKLSSQSLADCQKYYQTGILWNQAIAQVYISNSTMFPVIMRVAPTVTYADGVGNANRFTNGSTNNLSINAGGISSYIYGLAMNANASIALTGNTSWIIFWTADARL